MKNFASVTGLEEHNYKLVNGNREFCEIFRTLSFDRKICDDILIEIILIPVQFDITSNVFGCRYAHTRLSQACV